MRASSVFIFEWGMTTSSWPACSPLRMRVRKSAIGSVIDIALYLPARLLDAGDQALMRDLAEADPAQAELAEVRARATAALAAVVVAGRVLGRARLLYTLGSLGHSLLSLRRCRLIEGSGVLALVSWARRRRVRLGVLFFQLLECSPLGLGLRLALLVGDGRSGRGLLGAARRAIDERKAECVE